MKKSELRKIIKEELQKSIQENIEDFVTIEDWIEYLKKKGYAVSANRVKKTKNGFEANLKSTPDKKDFTQIGKLNWVRLSFKDIGNPKITNGKFLHDKIIKGHPTNKYWSY